MYFYKVAFQELARSSSLKYSEFIYFRRYFLVSLTNDINQIIVIQINPAPI